MIEFFRLLYNPPPKHVNPIGLTCLKTPKVPRPDRDPGAGTLYCKKLLHSIFQYKSSPAQSDVVPARTRLRGY